jgi:hypothetical protein
MDVAYWGRVSAKNLLKKDAKNPQEVEQLIGSWKFI